MSTRASYTFEESYREVVVYKHHDGYPEGAARWVSRAYDKESVGLNITPESFIRANQKVRITDKPHGDEQYRYFITGDEIVVKYREIRNETPKWEKIFDGTMNEFFEKYLR